MANGIVIDGDTTTGGGHIVNGTLYNLIVNLVQEIVPLNDPLLQQLRNTKTTDDLNVLIFTIKYWKDVHNGLDEIRNRFDIFREPLSHSQIMPLRIIHLSWGPVSSKLCNYKKVTLNAYKTESAYLEKFSSGYNSNRENDVEDWRYRGDLLGALEKDISVHLGEAKYPGLLHERWLRNTRIRFGVDSWWNHLIEMSDQAHSHLTESMFLADKILRNTAENFHQFSQNIIVQQGK